MTEPQGRMVEIMGRSLITPGMILENLTEVEGLIGDYLNRTDIAPEWRNRLEETLQEILRQKEVAAHKDPRPIIKDIPILKEPRP